MPELTRRRRRLLVLAICCASIVVVVMDISMGPVSGVEATRELRQRCPETRILVVTVHEDRSYVQELLEAGASGYMVKRAAAEELIAALRAVATKGMHIDTRVAGKLVASLFAPRAGTSGTGGVPSERESEVLRLIARGYTNKEIAGQLSVSVKTVETYKSRAMEKLGLRSRVDIVRYAGESGWLRV